MFTPVRHSFASLLDKQLSRKATLFQDVLLFELFQQTLPNPLLFSFKSTQKCSRQNLPVRKKAYCNSHSVREGYTLFSGPLSNQSACAMIWKQAQPCNKSLYSTLLEHASYLIFENILKGRNIQSMKFFISRLIYKPIQGVVRTFTILDQTRPH